MSAGPVAENFTGAPEFLPVLQVKCGCIKNCKAEKWQRTAGPMEAKVAQVSEGALQNTMRAVTKT